MSIPGTLHRLLFCCLCCLTVNLKAQQSTVVLPIDSFTESHIKSFKVVGVTDTSKTIVRATVLEMGNPKEPIQGATVLLRREKDKMLGRVTKQDGRCNFMPVPATYSIRVQLTGYKSLEATGLVFESGKVYELELRMARN